MEMPGKPGDCVSRIHPFARRMDQPGKPLSRKPLHAELLYLAVGGTLFLGGLLAWKHFHHERRLDAPQSQERAEGLNDHL